MDTVEKDDGEGEVNLQSRRSQATTATTTREGRRSKQAIDKLG